MSEHDGFRVERDDERPSRRSRSTSREVQPRLDERARPARAALRGAGPRRRRPVRRAHGRRRERSPQAATSPASCSVEPGTSRASPTTSPLPSAAPKPVIAHSAATASASASSSRSPATSASQPTTSQLALPEVTHRDDPGQRRHAAARAAGRARAREGHRHARAPRRRRGGAGARPRHRGRPVEELGAAVDRLVAELSATPRSRCDGEARPEPGLRGPARARARARRPRLRPAPATHDFREGVEAFTEKRPPEFRGD